MWQAPLKLTHTTARFQVQTLAKVFSLTISALSVELSFRDGIYIDTLFH